MPHADGFIEMLLWIAAVYAPIVLMYRYRASAMQALAQRFGFRYSKGTTPLWFAPRGYFPIPTSFRLKGWPVSELSRTWNVIEGEINGASLVILDSVLGLGVKSGMYCTFVAFRSEENPFDNRSSREEIAQSNGWTALYRSGWMLIPWTLSIDRIEEHLKDLQIVGARP